MPEWRAKWSIGVYAGNDPFHLEPLPGVRNPVLTAQHVTDAPAAFVADPFVLRAGSEWFLFFEVWNNRSGRGEVACARSADMREWHYAGIVLSELFHLSYPCVFEHGGRIFMVPETREVNAIRLYESVTFPHSWQFVRELLRGNYADATFFDHEGSWWMFAQRGLDELRLFRADAPDGRWTEHPANPLWSGNRTYSRPGGRIFKRDGRLFRFAQDGVLSYGNNLRALEIERLDREGYAEREIESSPILKPAWQGWNSMGMHHIDLQRNSAADGPPWIAVVDGANLGFC